MANNFSRKSDKAANNFRKADAFFNVSVKMTDADGNEVIKQIGGIPLHQDKDLHAALMELRKELDDLELVFDIRDNVDNSATGLSFIKKTAA
jgi:uncharacterized FlaG/YvyC family protein